MLLNLQPGLLVRTVICDAEEEHLAVCGFCQWEVTIPSCFCQEEAIQCCCNGITIRFGHRVCQICHRYQWLGMFHESCVITMGTAITALGLVHSEI